ncbi:MAG: 30S ribosomal protein S11 [Bdellovibrionaceae bacterium]|nr:30S ribosomal protein S11 [Pseudobdellovibrionaceae bacterium]MDW8190880.1 30S ribosomal protein S11 [Pseudobdellovibrionaceae bacterium]
MSSKTESSTQGKKKAKKTTSPMGIAHVYAGFGNVIVTITDHSGNAIAWSSAGVLGFKGTRKGTPFAAQVTVEDACKKALAAGVKAVDVRIKGPGAGREPAIRSIAGSGLRILSLKDVTPIPHNGCRPPKRRRV